MLTLLCIYLITGLLISMAYMKLDDEDVVKKRNKALKDGYLLKAMMLVTIGWMPIIISHIVKK